MPPILEIIKKANRNLHRVVLGNGMICLVKEDHAAPVVSIQIWVGTGSIHEHEYLGAGLSHYVEHMIFKGTPSRPPGRITREINDAGGAINAYTGFDRTVFYTDMPSRHWKVGVDVLADAVMHATFPEEEWQREKDVILREFAMVEDDPSRVLSRMLWSSAFVAHPYRIPIIGYLDVFNTMGRDELIAFFRRNYVPDNMIVVVAGDVGPEAVMAVLRTTFAGFKRAARAPSLLPSEPPQLAPRLTHQTGPYNISRLAWAYHTVRLSDADAPALDMLANMAGQGQSSPLVQRIVETARLAYNIDAWSYTPREPGLFGIDATFEPGKEDALIAAIQAEIERWAADGFTPEEFKKARRTLLTSTLSGLQTANGQANSAAAGEFYAADPAFTETYLQRIEDVTPESVQALVGRYLSIGNRTIAVLSPEKAAAPKPAAAAPARAAVSRHQIAPDGLTLLVREDHRLPFVNICAVCRGGLAAETESNNGITHLMAEMLLRGTRTRSAVDIARAAESLGGSISAFSDADVFGVAARCLALDLGPFMDLVADCLTQPAFPEAEMDKQKAIQIAAIAEQRDQPFYIAQEAMRQALFSGHPYRWSILGSADTVTRITRHALDVYFRKHATTGNMVLSLFGDITESTVRSIIEPRLAALTAGKRSRSTTAPAMPQLPFRAVRPFPREQSIILVGFPGVHMGDPRHDALDVLQTAVRGLSSELGDEVREKRGLAYYVGASLRADADGGWFAFYAGTRLDAVDEVQRLIAQEIERLTVRGLTAVEIARAKNQILAAYEMSLQDNMRLATACAADEMLGLGYDFMFSTPARIEAVTADAIRTAAGSILLKERQAVSVVVPEAAAKDRQNVS